jgi:hypothetical protein
MGLVLPVRKDGKESERPQDREDQERVIGEKMLLFITLSLVKGNKISGLLKTFNKHLIRKHM